MARNRMEVSRDGEKESHEKKQGTIYLELAACLRFKYFL